MHWQCAISSLILEKKKEFRTAPGNEHLGINLTKDIKVL